MNGQKVIVLLPIYRNDSPEYLQQAVDSMLVQTYEPLHILLGIDGRIDGQLTQTIEAYSTNERITILSFEENRGLAATLNDMIRWAQQRGYTYFVRMDADDRSYPERVQLQMDYLRAHPEVDAVGGATNVIDENGNNRGKVRNYPLTPDECYAYFSRRDPVAHPAVLIKQSFFDKAGCLYRPGFRRNQDTMLWLDGLKNGAKIANVPEVVLDFRETDELFNKRRKGWAYAHSLLKERNIINRDLHYGFKGMFYAYLLFLFRISPAWLVRVVYKFW